MIIPHLSRRRVIQCIGGGIIFSRVIGLGSAEESTVEVEETDSKIALSNRYVSVEVSPENGGIAQIEAKDSETKLIDPTGPEPSGLWELKCYHDEHDVLIGRSSSTGSPTIEISENSDDARIALRWDEGVPMNAPEEPDYEETFDGVVSATVSVRADDPNIYWNVEIENDDDLAVRSISFPKINNISEMRSEGRDALVLPVRMGRRITDPIPLDSPHSVRYPSGFGTMQFTAYTNPGGGFYFQATDTEGHLKRFNWSPEGEEHVTFQHVYDSPLEPGEDVSVPYEIEIRPLDGDWYSAADQYREWLTEEGMLSEEKLSIPDWYYERGATIRSLSYFREELADEEDNLEFDRTAEAIIEAREQIRTPIQFEWWGYQEHGRPGSGDWFPPKEGWESFRDVMTRFAENDIAPYGFMNVAHMYDVSDLYREREAEVETWVLRNEDQSKKEASSNAVDGKKYRVHFAADGWFEEVQDAATMWVKEGAKQVWIDGFPWGMPFDECFADDHDHPPGIGGNWWATEGRAKFEELRNEIHEIDNTVLFSGEGIADYFATVLDIQHTRDIGIETRGSYLEEQDVIPLTTYTFGNRTLLRGHLPYLLLDEEYTQSPTYLRLALARSLNWGALPLFRVGTRQRLQPNGELYDEELMEYASRIARVFAVHGQRFLIDGQLVRPPSIDIPQSQVRAATGHSAEGEVREFPTADVQISAWETESGDETAVLLTNITDETTDVTVSVDSTPFPDDEDRLFYTVRNGAYKQLEIGDAKEIEEELSVNDVVLLISAPDTRDRRTALSRVGDAQRVAPSDGEESDIFAAKQKFAAGDFTEATRISSEIIERSESGSEEQENNRSNESGAEGEEVSERAPGFTIGSALTALGATVYLLKQRLEGKDDR